MKPTTEGFLEGEITSVDTAKGIGTISFIRKSESKEAEKNEILFQVADLIPGTAITDLNIGTRVSLNTVMSENGPQATSISKIVEADLRENDELIIGPFTGVIRKLRDNGIGFVEIKNEKKDLLFTAKDLRGVTFEDLQIGDTVQIGTIGTAGESNTPRRAHNITIGGKPAA